MSALNNQVGGNHYSKLPVQPLFYSMENKMDACQHTIIKYVTRFRDKGGIEDLRKAKHTLEWLIEYEEGKKEEKKEEKKETETAPASAPASEPQPEPASEPEPELAFAEPKAYPSLHLLPINRVQDVFEQVSRNCKLGGFNPIRQAFALCHYLAIQIRQGSGSFMMEEPGVGVPWCDDIAKYIRMRDQLQDVVNGRDLVVHVLELKKETLLALIKKHGSLLSYCLWRVGASHLLSDESEDKKT